MPAAWPDALYAGTCARIRPQPTDAEALLLPQLREGVDVVADGAPSLTDVARLTGRFVRAQQLHQLGDTQPHRVVALHCPAAGRHLKLRGAVNVAEVDGNVDALVGWPAVPISGRSIGLADWTLSRV